MNRVAVFVGLDVHKDKISIAAAKEGRAAARHLADIPSDPVRLLKRLDQLGERDTISCCYEAGPTGYGLCRKLIQAGVECTVVAPTLIPKKAGDRVKTDKRDARKLAQYHRSGDLTAVWVPDASTEALRDLVRARAATKADERSARHRLGKFLLRHDRRYPGKTSWTKMHLDWVRGQKFEHEAQSRVLSEHLNTVEEIGERIGRFDAYIEELARASSLWPLIRSLQVLKGIRLLTASSIASELGDLRRFESPRFLMSYLGLVASEHSTGMSTRRGGITKAGNGHLRRLLTESAWAYRHPPRKDWHLRARSEGASPELLRIGWQAQHRLNRRFRVLVGRGKPRQVTTIAIARELAGFVWAIGQEVDLTAG
jgi:transposase